MLYYLFIVPFRSEVKFVTLKAGATRDPTRDRRRRQRADDQPGAPRRDDRDRLPQSGRGADADKDDRAYPSLADSLPVARVREQPLPLHRGVIDLTTPPVTLSASNRRTPSRWAVGSHGAHGLSARR